jgi:dTMP kinase
VSDRYIALEGVEGSGKTSVGRALAGLIEERGSAALLVREPGSTELGEEIRSLLLHSGHVVPWAEAALFAAQRAQLAAEVIAPALAEGVWVISDRSYYSSLAYQGGARSLGIEAVRRINEVVLAGTVPGLVAVIDVDPALGLARQLDADRIGAEGLEFQQAVAAAYHRLALDEPDRVVLVEGSDGVGDIAGRILQMAEAMWSM